MPIVPSVRSSLIRTAALEALEGRRLMARQPFGYYGEHGDLVINGTAGNDAISCQQRGARTIVIMNGVKAQFTTAGFGYLNVQAGDGKDVVDFSRMTVPCYVNLGTGNDIAYGGAGNDSLTGAAGRDTLYGNGGVDRLAGGNTGDAIYGGDGDDVIYGGYGTDLLFGEAGRDHIFGEQDADTLDGGAGSDGLYGGDGNDSLTAHGGDYLSGEAGDDTLNAQNGLADGLVDGGDGNDTVLMDANLETAVNAETVNGAAGTPTGPGTPVDPPVVPVGGDLATAVSFNDESLWDNNFTDAVAKTKALGVKVVRVWLEVTDYTERPHAYDNVSTADIVHNWRKGTAESDRAVTGGLAMKRAFALKRAGFQVILTVSEHSGNPPASDQQVKDFYTFLLNSTETTGSTVKLKDAVDYWEVAQEVDLADNWKPSGSNKSSGLKQYVDDVLIPASTVLHAGPTSNWEKVISASVSYNPNDLNTILTEAKAQGQLNALDYAGYHPYGRYVPDQNIDEIKNRVSSAVKLSKQFGKPLAATEWNIRGYPIDGSKDTEWASSVNRVYRDYIAPNFGIAVYFSLIDNLDGRGGGTNVTARPAGLLKHNSPIGVTPTSSTSDLQTYYNSPLVANDRFYDVFAAF